MAAPTRTNHQSHTARRAWLPRTIIGVEIFVGVASVGGGIGLLTDSIGLSEDYLDGTIFESYLIPGLLLIFVVGGALFGAAALMWKHHRWAPEVSLIAAAILLIWIVVQLAMVGYISWMQPAVFASAIVLGVLSWWHIRTRQTEH